MPASRPWWLPAADELREYLLFSVGQTGGHFGAGLGVVELTIALHHVFDTPRDRLVWDVGHQAYPHKILTGRMQRMHTHAPGGRAVRLSQAQRERVRHLRRRPLLDEYLGGHGHGHRRGSRGRPARVVAVIGDGAITGGMAFEALAHAGDVRPDMLVILNDNQMSIGHNTGGLASYFAKIWASKTYIAMREGGKKVLKKIKPAWDLAKRTEEHMKGMVSRHPVRGARLALHRTHRRPRPAAAGADPEQHARPQGPQFLHVLTMKGKGYAPAEADPVGFHAINKLEESPPLPPGSPWPHRPVKSPSTRTCSASGSATWRPSRTTSSSPSRRPCARARAWSTTQSASRSASFDVAIAEQHAVTLAAGMACEGMKPVVAIYSTFLQRAYDQLIHDVALQKLDVTFAIDRAGLVGQDGPTHHGAFDLSYLRCIPNMVIGAPSDENECRQMLYTAYRHPGPRRHTLSARQRAGLAHRGTHDGAPDRARRRRAPRGVCRDPELRRPVRRRDGRRRRARRHGRRHALGETAGRRRVSTAPCGTSAYRTILLSTVVRSNCASLPASAEMRSSRRPGATCARAPRPGAGATPASRVPSCRWLQPESDQRRTGAPGRRQRDRAGSRSCSSGL
jgi:1-deoxy-D-xylulose-5-phosphate synthase